MDMKALTGMNLDPRLQSPGAASLEGRIRAMQEAGPATAGEKALMGAAQDFESYFIYMLLKEMRKTVNESPLFHGGRAEEIFRDMMDEEMGKKMAANPGGNGLGIARMLYEQLSRPLITERLQREAPEQNLENVDDKGK